MKFSLLLIIILSSAKLFAVTYDRDYKRVEYKSLDTNSSDPETVNEKKTNNYYKERKSAINSALTEMYEKANKNCNSSLGIDTTVSIKRMDSEGDYDVSGVTLEWICGKP